MKNILINHAGFGAGSGGMTMDLLWENASTTSEFAAQTVNMPIEEYKFIHIDILYTTSSTLHVINATIPVNIGESFFLSFPYNNGWSRLCRTVVLQKDSLEFGICQKSVYNSASNTTENTSCIPYRIYGIK